MPAQLNYAICPVCGEVRNTNGLTTHIKKKHGGVK